MSVKFNKDLYKKAYENIVNTIKSGNLNWSNLFVENGVSDNYTIKTHHGLYSTNYIRKELSFNNNTTAHYEVHIILSFLYNLWKGIGYELNQPTTQHLKNLLDITSGKKYSESSYNQEKMGVIGAAIFAITKQFDQASLKRAYDIGNFNAMNLQYINLGNGKKETMNEKQKFNFDKFKTAYDTLIRSIKSGQINSQNIVHLNENGEVAFRTRHYTTYTHNYILKSSYCKDGQFKFDPDDDSGYGLGIVLIFLNEFVNVRPRHYTISETFHSLSTTSKVIFNELANCIDHKYYKFDGIMQFVKTISDSLKDYLEIVYEQTGILPTTLDPMYGSLATDECIAPPVIEVKKSEESSWIPLNKDAYKKLSQSDGQNTIQLNIRVGM